MYLSDIITLGIGSAFIMMIFFAKIETTQLPLKIKVKAKRK